MKVITSFVASMLATATLAISKDGLWTGHDWSSSVAGIKDVDGVTTGLNAAMQTKIESL